jgi:hypothetical protein
MSKKFLKDSLGWGFLLWLVGFGLSMILFSVVPLWAIGWIIMPIGIFITLWVLHKKIKSEQFQYFVKLAVIWTLIAIVCDNFFIVKAFNPTDGYYKLDVYLYYALTFALPLLVGMKKSQKKY